MNKIFKYLLIGIGIGSIFFASCKADLTPDYTIPYIGATLNVGNTYSSLIGGNPSARFRETQICISEYFVGGTNQEVALLECDTSFNNTTNIYNNSHCTKLYTSIKVSTTGDVVNGNMKCYKMKTGYYYYKATNSNNNQYSYTISLGLEILENYFSGQCPSCPTCPTCDEPYTSLECQTEYNLIPISSVTSAYCESNFNLIDPASCPISEGTGAINWSSLFINNTQYAGNDEIQILFPDYLAWNIVFNTGVTYVEVEGYNADTDYIEDVIAKEKLTPTADDFSFLIENLGAYIPILAVAGLLIRGARILKKVF